VRRNHRRRRRRRRRTGQDGATSATAGVCAPEVVPLHQLPARYSFGVLDILYKVRG